MRDVHFEKLTKRAIAAYTLERNALLNSDEDAMRKADVEKSALMAELDAVEAQVKAAPNCMVTLRNREGLASLLSIIARRTAENQQLAKANQPSTGSGWNGR